MIHINLIPAQVTQTEIKLNPVIAIGSVAGVLSLLLIPLTLSQYSTKRRLETETKSLKSELDRYQPIIQQVDALESARTRLQQRKSLIQSLESERLRYPQFMDDFLKVLPSNLWLTNLNTTTINDANMTVSMDVVALDNYAIADLISNLETSQIFSDVDLGAITSSQNQGSGSILNFHINMAYHKMNGKI